MSVSIDITDDGAFDAYVASYGWHYDNHGEYRSEDWAWYASAMPGLVLLRQAPSRVALVRFDEIVPFELWLGSVFTSHQFDEMMQAKVGTA